MPRDRRTDLEGTRESLLGLPVGAKCWLVLQGHQLHPRVRVCSIEKGGAANAAPAGAATAAAGPPLAQVVAALQATLAAQQATLAAQQDIITQMEARLTAAEDKNRQLEGMVQDLQRQNSITEPQVATAAAVAGSSHDWDSSTWAGWSGSGTWDEGTGGGSDGQMMILRRSSAGQLEIAGALHGGWLWPLTWRPFLESLVPKAPTPTRNPLCSAILH